MTVSASCLPALVTVSAGIFNGTVIDSFCLGRTTVTNAQYAAHIDHYLDRPYVLLRTDPITHATSVLRRAKNPEEAMGDLAKHRLEGWDSRDPFMFGAFVLFQLRKDMSFRGFDRPHQPVVGVSWFHAFEYCASNGFYLPTDDQWSYAAGVHEGREYATSTGELWAADGKTPLAHFNGYPPVDVDDPRYPDGPHGLRHMTGNVREWTEWNPNFVGTPDDYPYGLRGGDWTCYGEGLGGFLEDLLSNCRDDDPPHSRSDTTGFRVAATLETSQGEAV